MEGFWQRSTLDKFIIVHEQAHGEETWVKCLLKLRVDRKKADDEVIVDINSSRRLHFWAAVAILLWISTKMQI